MGPLLTKAVCDRLIAGRRAGDSHLDCSLDLQRTSTRVDLHGEYWISGERHFPYPDRCKDRTVYYWTEDGFRPVARFTSSLIKLVPTDWGPPTFEIDGIKMLPTAKISPYVDAERKVALIEPRGKVILDTCGGLGYFAAWCLAGGAQRILSFEKNPDVIWLRSLNPWSPIPVDSLLLTIDDVTQAIATQATASVDAVLHDPPRFGIAGELYSQQFYDALARVLRPRGVLFHYVGNPNRLTSGRDVPNEVATRLRSAGFDVEPSGDGLLAMKRATHRMRPR